MALDLHYSLPQELVATEPADPREASRLFVVHRPSLQTEHRGFLDVLSYVKPGDLLVLNQARVDPVRIPWRKAGGGKAELLLLDLLSQTQEGSRWEAILSGKRIREGQKHELPGGMRMCLESRGQGAMAVVHLEANAQKVRSWMMQVGLPPLPPYILSARKRKSQDLEKPEDVVSYQTVFARQPGAVAAPTAGLHFSKKLFQDLQQKGVEIAYVHLAVGWGTFEPLTQQHWQSGRLHAERVEVDAKTAKAISKAKEEGRRVIAVGTTVVRSLEWWHDQGRPEDGLAGFCDSFLFPPWQPSVVDALITNFHLPDSSLIALVAAFLGEGGREKILRLYKEAVEKKYRFFSFGDAMLIL